MPAEATADSSLSVSELQLRVEELAGQLRSKCEEYEEALQREAAVSEILQVINAPGGDLAPVFDAVVEKAMRLCGASFGILRTYDGSLYHGAASRGVPAAYAEFLAHNPQRAQPGTIGARILAGEPFVHVIDVADDNIYPSGDPHRRALVELGGARTSLVVPLTKERAVLGAIQLYRQHVQAFSEKQITLLQDFAAQAVIAMENARLLDELRERTRELTTSFEYQTATSAVLNIISRSPTDTQPVFDAIAESTARLCETEFCTVYRFDGEFMYFMASYGVSTAVREDFQRAYPMRAGRGSCAARAILSGEVEQIPDVHADPDHRQGHAANAMKINSVVAAPMLKEGRPVGAIALSRAPKGAFPQRQIELLQTFRVPPVGAAERRQVTIMFCDLVDSTALSAGLDPEDLRAVIAAYYREVAVEVQRFGGFVARHVGDGVLVYFGYPAAHENDSERAVRAGLALISAIRRLKLRPGIVLDARVGIATGLVVVDMIGEGPGREWTVLGDAPNLAARLQAFAEPGTVLIAPTTHRLIGDLFECSALGPREIKGLAGPMQVWQVLRPRDVANRFLARDAAYPPAVGRAEEIELLLRRWKQAKSSEGRVVLISGEPGIGKSRLARTVEDHIAKELHLRLRYFGSALHEDSALFPFIGQLEHAAGIGREDSAETRLDKLAALLEPYAANPQQEVALFAELLGIDGGKRYPALELSPRIRMERTLAALLSQFVNLSARRPVLATFEDVHWFDPSSHEALQRAIERLQTLPVLLVVTARPEFQPDWVGLPHVTLLTLNRLSRRECALLIEHLTAGKPLPEQVAQQIVERTDGVPLFVEELTQTVVEGGYLREGADRYVFYGPLPELALPATLQGSLLARLDRLGAVREIAQEAAAIGREFAYELLAAVTGRSEAELAKGLDQLVASGLVQQRGTPPAASYSFKHALLQDAAYSTLLRSKRQALHARIAEAYDQRFHDIIDTRPELMAHHLAQAGFAERSIGFWVKAARVAMARGAAAEAVAQLHRGLALLGEIADHDNRRRQELELQIALGNALTAATGYTGTQTDAAFRRARELCLEVGDTVQLVRVTWGQFTGHFAGGRQRQALAVANELLALSERLDDAGGRQMGHASVGVSLLHLASFAEARTQFERALAIDAASEREWTHLYGQSGRVTALAYMSLGLVPLGHFDAAQRLAEQSVEEARRLAHPTSLCFVHSIVCRVYYLLRDREALARHSAMVVRLADEHGLGLWRALGSIYAGWSRAESGAAREGMAMIRDGIAKYRAAGAALSLPLFLASLASLEGATGNQREALELLGQAQAAGTAGDEHWMSAEIHRLTGEAMLAGNGNAAGAERKFQAALALAREQGARLWELRAATSLARLSRDGNGGSAARDKLASVYRSFSEGFTEPDLEQAKAVLGE